MSRITGIGGVFAWILDPADNNVELWEPMLRDEEQAVRRTIT